LICTYFYLVQHPTAVLFLCKATSVVTDSEADTESRFFPQSVRHQNLQNLGFFVAVSDSFGSSVRKMTFTYQVTVFKRRVTRQLLAAVTSYRRPSSSRRVGVGSGVV